uniref:antigen peptide transporter 2a isoform X3 n=1 Tax=Doryrhamphus excisus TaxID=161450 RepID=UPI0025AE6ECF|nr:antigen peptide transporter 2a isoform X3 [Doryrhamphus excisus]
MATISVPRQVFAWILAICVDTCLVYATVVVAPLESTRETYARLGFVWVFALLRCLALAAVTAAALGGLPPAPARLLAAHCALPAVLETGALALRLDDNRCGVMADARCWLMCAGASLVAASFWEVVVPDFGGDKEKRNKPRVLFMRVVRLYKPDYPVMFAAFLFLTVAVVCQMAIQFYTGKIIDHLRGPDLPSEFFLAILLMGLYSLGSSVGAGCRGGLFTWARSSFMCRVNGNLFEALTKQEVAFFETVKTGEMTSRLSKDTSLMGDTACLNINVLLRNLIKKVVILALMLQLSWKLTFLVLMEVPVTGLIQNIYNKHEQRLKVAIQDSVAVASETANEIILGIRTVRSFSAEKHEARHYGNRLLDTHNLKAQRDTSRIVYLLLRRALIYISCNMVNSVGAAAKVFEYLDREPQVSTKGEQAPDQLKGHVVFRHLNFVYPTRPNVPVLQVGLTRHCMNAALKHEGKHVSRQDFSLELKAGQMTALVGPSGEGKSTCASLLKRWYEPLDGQILLDDAPLESYDHHFLSKKIALVSQEPVLFSGTVRHNIAYGIDVCSMDAVQEAARQANAHDFITQLEKGYDTEVGEGGSLLSKSERQRIAIARAMVRQPQVLILDEITSSLDEHSENKVLHTLASRCNQTLLVIAHRLKTIEKADQIVVIGGGKVQEQGTHRELLDKKGSYCKMRNKLATRGSD